MSPWFEQYKPGWGLSDAHIESPLDHLWQITITGLDAGQAMSLVNSSKQILVRAIAQSGVPLRMSALIPPSGKNELTVVRGRTSNAGPLMVQAKQEAKVNKAGKHEIGTCGIEVGKYQIVQLGSIPLNEECQSIQTTTILAKTCVFAVVRDGIKAFDLPIRGVPCEFGRG